MHPTSHPQSGPRKATSWALCSDIKGREGVHPLRFSLSCQARLPRPGCGLSPTLQLLFLGSLWICQLQEGSRVGFPVGRGQAGRRVWVCEHPAALRDSISVPGLCDSKSGA